MRDELDIRRKTEIHEIEERKNQQINTLMRNHEKAFSDIKNYYNDITLNNLSLINTLKVIKNQFILVEFWLFYIILLQFIGFIKIKSFFIAIFFESFIKVCKKN